MTARAAPSSDLRLADDGRAERCGARRRLARRRRRTSRRSPASGRSAPWCHAPPAAPHARDECCARRPRGARSVKNGRESATSGFGGKVSRNTRLSAKGHMCSTAVGETSDLAMLRNSDIVLIFQIWEFPGILEFRSFLDAMAWEWPTEIHLETPCRQEQLSSRPAQGKRGSPLCAHFRAMSGKGPRSNNSDRPCAPPPQRAKNTDMFLPAFIRKTSGAGFLQEGGCKIGLRPTIGPVGMPHEPDFPAFQHFRKLCRIRISQQNLSSSCH